MNAPKASSGVDIENCIAQHIITDEEIDMLRQTFDNNTFRDYVEGIVHKNTMRMTVGRFGSDGSNVEGMRSIYELTPGTPTERFLRAPKLPR